MAKQLTYDELKERLKNFSSRAKAWKLDSSAINSAKNQGLLDELLPPAKKQPQLTEALVRARAANYKTKNEFKRADDYACRWARKNNLIDLLFPPKPLKSPKLIKPAKLPKPIRERLNRKLSHDIVRAAASGHINRLAFMKADSSAEAYARKRGLIDELFPIDLRVIDQSSFIKKAREVHGKKYNYQHVRYKSVQQKVKIVCPIHGAFWQRPGAHARGSGCAECCGFDNNAFYLKLAERCFYNGLQVYKVGVTSHRLGDARLIGQEKNSGITHQVLIPPTPTIGAATDVEGYALSLGENPMFHGFDGATEYRAYTKGDLKKITDMLDLCSAPVIEGVVPKRKPSGVRAPRPPKPDVIMNRERRAAIKLEVVTMFKSGKYSRAELAEMFDFSYSRVSNWLQGVVPKPTVSPELELFLCRRRAGLPDLPRPAILPHNDQAD